LSESVKSWEFYDTLRKNSRNWAKDDQNLGLTLNQ
jgi:hypothetical protein